MDVGLPDTNGFDLAGEVRSLAPETAIIFLTAFSNPEDRIKGLEIGAEDYVIKPFHFKELLLRIQNGLKRALSLSAPGNSKNQVKIGKAEIDFPKFQVRVGGKTQALSHKECAVLGYCSKDKEMSSVATKSWILLGLKTNFPLPER